METQTPLPPDLADAELFRLSDSLDKASVPFLAIDTVGRILSWNKTCGHICGLSSQQDFGTPLQELLASGEPDALTQVEEALRATQVEGFEVRLRGPDARRICFQAQTWTGCLQATVTVLIGVDVTRLQQRRAEAAPMSMQSHTGASRADAPSADPELCTNGKEGAVGEQTTLERCASADTVTCALEMANVPIFGIDTLGLVNVWNRKVAALTKYSHKELVGRDLVEELIPVERQPSVRATFEGVLQGKEAANFELVLLDKNQQEVEMLLSITARRDVSGVIVGALAIGQDITAWRQAEGDKKQGAQDLNLFIDTANVPIIGIDMNGLVTEWNCKAEKITEYQRQDVMGRQFVKHLILPEHHDLVQEALVNAFSGIDSSLETPLLTQTTKHKVDMLLNVNPRKDENGEVAGVYILGQDITSCLRAMEMDSQLSCLRASNDAKSQFLAHVSHEMRTPLNGIIGVNQLLIDTGLNSDQAALVKLIASSSEGLLCLINDILDLTR
ncbi:hypothetical protein CYMTET_26154, partial [Cymbomonas tetramitiformis]